MEAKIKTFTCPCGYPQNGPEQLRGNLMVCKSCGNTSYVDENHVLGHSYVKYFPFQVSLDEFKLACMRLLMESGPKDIFQKMSDIEWRRVMVPMREIGKGKKRFAICLGDADLVKGLMEDKVYATQYDKIFPSFDAQNFSDELLSSDLDSHNLPQIKEILPITLTEEIVCYEYKTKPEESYVIKFWPVFICTFKYKKEKYSVKAFGNMQESAMYSNINEAKGKRLIEPKYDFFTDFEYILTRKGISSNMATTLILSPAFIDTMITIYQDNSGGGYFILLIWVIAIFSIIWLFLRIFGRLFSYYVNAIIAAVKCSIKGINFKWHKQQYDQIRMSQMNMAINLFKLKTEDYDRKI
jgi:hypothetical protein